MPPHDRPYDRAGIRRDVPMPPHADGDALGDVERVSFEAQRGAASVLA